MTNEEFDGLCTLVSMLPGVRTSENLIEWHGWFIFIEFPVKSVIDYNPHYSEYSLNAKYELRPLRERDTLESVRQTIVAIYMELRKKYPE